ncbi:MAG: GNAT family N-acetyltransferase [Planctomycetes bacterium]|nr:GNAT family N-acetyltransferase [Planctomycetota bacterium]
MVSETGFCVLRADARDVEDFARLRIELFVEQARPDPVRELDALIERTRAAYQRGIGERTLLVWMARADSGRAIGALAMHLFPRLPSPASPTGEEGYVVNVYTSPDWRRRGVGSALMRSLLEESRRLRLGRLRLHTTREGRYLYSRFGFRDHADKSASSWPPCTSSASVE